MRGIDIRDRLAKLLDAIQKVEMDAETRRSVRKLDSDIHDLLRSNRTDDETASLLRRAKALEASIAKKYPTAARILGDLLDAIAEIGV